MSQADRALQVAFSPIRVVPTVSAVIGTAAGVVIADSTASSGAGGACRRVHIVNTGSNLGGVVWASRADPSATKITGQTIANATCIPAGGTLDLLVEADISLGYVGLGANLSVTISEV
jgi:hypothetical protein